MRAARKPGGGAAGDLVEKVGAAAVGTLQLYPLAGHEGAELGVEVVGVLEVWGLGV